MENIIKFINSFLEDEYQAHTSYINERDKEKQLNDANKHRAYFDLKMLNPPGFFRKGEINDQWFEERKNTEVYKRTLFQIKEYDNEKYGKIYRCYLSNPDYNKKRYYQCHFIAEIKGNLKIFSIYQIDISLKNLNTSIKDWKIRGGEELKNLGKPTNIVKIEPPLDNEVHLEEYGKE